METCYIKAKNCQSNLLDILYYNLSQAYSERSPVNQESNRPQTIFGAESEANNLWQYVQSLSPETIAQLSQPNSQEVVQLMERNIIGLLGHLSSEQFEVSISTSREHLGKLLASAMMSGYFIRNAEQRMTFEKSIQGVEEIHKAD